MGHANLNLKQAVVLLQVPGEKLKAEVMESASILPGIASAKLLFEGGKN